MFFNYNIIMIEYLSNPGWLTPQIDFLLLLQNLRVCHFEMFNNLFLSITMIGEFWLPTLICAVFYWCIDCKSGTYLFMLSAYNIFFVHLFKMMACIYRPWVLSDKIHPVEKAFAIAAGYSFPSGHSAQSSATIGGLAYLVRKKIWISVLLVILVFFVGFSRLWLGVHTPQDVVVGLLIGFSLVFILNNVVNWAENDKNRYLYILGITNAAIMLVLAYLCYFKSYPMDYVNGKLLVDPHHALQVSVFCYGYIAGILNGLCLCRRFFPFEIQGVNNKTKILRGLIGAVIVILSIKMGIKYLFCDMCDFKFVFIMSFIIGIFITAGYPYIFKKLRF